ncbi:MAG TPA: hypothetical protein VNL77_19315 [Roseiflexaceae bacterium]|nr:hypothetical protein [Roseiflexaceae bacterium]
MRETLKTVTEVRGPRVPEPPIAEWLASWPAVRCQALALLEEYRRLRPDYDPHWVEWVIGEMDDAVANLEHRAAWLRRHLAESPARTGMPPDR